MKTVVKGVPVGVQEKDLKEKLVGLGFKVGSVVRMRKDNASPLDMVTVTFGG